MPYFYGIDSFLWPKGIFLLIQMTVVHGQIQLIMRKTQLYFTHHNVLFWSGLQGMGFYTNQAVSIKEALQLALPPWLRTYVDAGPSLRTQPCTSVRIPTRVEKMPMWLHVIYVLV